MNNKSKDTNKNKSNNKDTRLRKLGTYILALLLTGFIFINIHSSSSGSSDIASFTSSEGTYVIDQEQLDIELIYDNTKYEVVNLSVDPYVVISGSNALINVLKWSGEPKFYIDLTGKIPGKYIERVQYSGISSELKVDFYPGTIELRVMEQQTISLEPVIELIGLDDVDEDYIVGIPEMLKREVKIRDIQDKLNLVGQVKGQIDVSDFTETKVRTVTLKVYDRDGNEMEEINLLDNRIDVKIPIQKRFEEVTEEVIKEVVIKEEVEKKRNGKLKFTDVPQGVTVKDLSGEVKFVEDVMINVSEFGNGDYEMLIEGQKIRFSVSGVPEKVREVEIIKEVIKEVEVDKEDNNEGNNDGNSEDDGENDSENNG